MAKKSNEVVTVTPEYTASLTAFAQKVQEDTGAPTDVASGRKYDKVYQVANEGKKCDFMVERSTGKIYGTKSWVMINYRREFGTLDTVSEWTWNGKRPTPISGTPSATAHTAREASIASTYGPRGRPKKVLTNS